VPDTASWLPEVRSIAAEAGEVLLGRLGRLGAGEIDKKGRIDLVTRADRESEALVVARLRARFPGTAVLAEEGGGAEGRRDGLVWCIDPLDGTTNYVHGFPVFAVAIALLEDGEPVLAVTHAPALRETWWAARGGGTFRNGERRTVSATASLEDALLATGFPYLLRELPYDNLVNFRALLEGAQGVRRAGAASLDLAWVAGGTFDGFWEPYLNPWDVAGGTLLVVEAGGVVTDFAGGPDAVFGRNLLATNGRVHEAVRARLRPFPGGGAASAAPPKA
jgi:myo-inositol-1(or 4)-monophosphatase